MSVCSQLLPPPLLPSTAVINSESIIKQNLSSAGGRRGWGGGAQRRSAHFNQPKCHSEGRFLGCGKMRLGAEDVSPAGREVFVLLMVPLLRSGSLEEEPRRKDSKLMAVTHGNLFWSLSTIFTAYVFPSGVPCQVVMDKVTLRGSTPPTAARQAAPWQQRGRKTATSTAHSLSGNPERRTA